ncbi:MAG TPA: hypothetical protein VEY30_10985, partial [Myxococcaceae bacterium]|nr:hypothetical protein [Myxococcaceae bacterium]
MLRLFFGGQTRDSASRIPIFQNIAEALLREPDPADREIALQLGIHAAFAVASTGPVLELSTPSVRTVKSLVRATALRASRAEGLSEAASAWLAERADLAGTQLPDFAGLDHLSGQDAAAVCRALLREALATAGECRKGALESALYLLRGLRGGGIPTQGAVPLQVPWLSPINSEAEATKDLVLTLVRGQAPNDIAREWGTSEEAVLERIKELGIRNRVHALFVADRAGWMTLAQAVTKLADYPEEKDDVAIRLFPLGLVERWVADLDADPPDDRQATALRRLEALNAANAVFRLQTLTHVALATCKLWHVPPTDSLEIDASWVTMLAHLAAGQLPRDAARAAGLTDARAVSARLAQFFESVAMDETAHAAVAWAFARGHLDVETVLAVGGGSPPWASAGEMYRAYFDEIDRQLLVGSLLGFREEALSTLAGQDPYQVAARLGAARSAFNVHDRFETVLAALKYEVITPAYVQATISMWLRERRIVEGARSPP